MYPSGAQRTLKRGRKSQLSDVCRWDASSTKHLSNGKAAMLLTGLISSAVLVRVELALIPTVISILRNHSISDKDLCS